MMDIKLNTQDNIQHFLDISNKVNSKATSLIRCQILALLEYSLDGIQYRELKAVLGVSDGKLISNLTKLLEMGYVEKQEVKLDNKNLQIYILTEAGRKELRKIKNWMDSFQKVTESCITT